jgi:hypothetical protein
MRRSNTSLLSYRCPGVYLPHTLLAGPAGAVAVDTCPGAHIHIAEDTFVHRKEDRAVLDMERAVHNHILEQEDNRAEWGQMLEEEGLHSNRPVEDNRHHMEEAVHWAGCWDKRCSFYLVDLAVALPKLSQRLKGTIYFS